MTEVCRTVYCETKSRPVKSLSGNKVHFVYILLKIRNKLIFFLLALLPVLFGGGSAVYILTSLLLQLLTLSAVLIPAALSRHYMRWQYDSRGISFSKGVFAKKEIFLYNGSIHSASVIKTPFLSLFKAVRLELRSVGNSKKPEITLFLSPDNANTLVSSIMHPTKVQHTLIPRTAPFLLTAVSRANFAVGLITLTAFLISLGNKPDQIYSELSRTAGNALPYLPPVISGFAVLFLVGWAVHFLSICFSDARQVTTVSEDCIVTVRGLISTRLTCIRKSSVSSCEVRQTLLTSLFGQNVISLTAPGQAENIRALTAWSDRDCNNACCDLTRPMIKPHISISVGDNSRLVWWLPYACGGVAVTLIWIKLFVADVPFLPIYSSLSALLLLLFIWKCALGIIGSGKAELEFSGQYILIRSVRRFSFCTQRIFLGNVAEFYTTQTILQKPRRLCTVYIRAVGAAHGLKCRNLPVNTVSALTERIK